MGARGPQPKPTALKLIAGNPGKRPINLADGVNPEVVVPDAPKHLSAEARKEWRRVTVELVELGLISRIDRAALALYCQSWGHMVLLEESLNGRMAAELARDDGIKPDPARAFYFVTDKGYQAQTVTVQMINTLRDQVHKYLKAFGMDPSSRARVSPSNNQLQLPGMDQGNAWAKHKQG
jgi:P27 family predicted phage terminase small subunit